MGRFNDHLGMRLGALVDGELEHDDRDRALAHLAGCAQCRTTVEAARSVKGQLAAMAMPEPSARLMAALFQIPQRETPTGPPDDPAPPASGFFGRSSAFLPEFAVGLRPVIELPDDPLADSGPLNRTRPARVRADQAVAGPAPFLGRTLPGVR